MKSVCPKPGHLVRMRDGYPHSSLSGNTGLSVNAIGIRVQIMTGDELLFWIRRDQLEVIGGSEQSKAR